MSAVGESVETTTTEAPAFEAQTYGEAGPNDADILRVMRERQGRGEEFEQKEAIRQRNIDSLVAQYGDQQFQYGSHTGTIVDMVNLCPPIMELVAQENGHNAIVAMIDEYKIEEKKEDEEVAEQEPEPDPVVEDEPQQNSPELAQAAPEPAAAEQAAQADVAEQAGSDEAVEAGEASDAGTTEQAAADSGDSGPESIADAAAVPEQQEPAIESVAAAVAPVLAAQATKDSPKKAEATVPTPVELIQKGQAPETNEVEQSNVQLELSEQPQPDVQESTATVEQDQETAEETDILEAVLENEIESNEEALEAELDTEFNADPEEEFGQTLEAIDTEEAPEQVADESEELDDTTIIIPHSELLESWQNLGEDDAPIEMTLSSITEHIDALEPNEEFEIDHPEIQLVLAKVDSVRDAINRVYGSRTKAECAEHIDELTKELTELLTLLGYKNPERAIEQFLKGNNFTSLDELLSYFETALRQSIEKELVTKKLKKTKHHSALGKLAMRIMHAFKPTYDVALS